MPSTTDPPHLSAPYSEHTSEHTSERPRLHSAAGAYSSTYHPDWSTLAARIAVSDLQKCTEASFAKNCMRLASHRHPKVRTT